MLCLFGGGCDHCTTLFVRRTKKITKQKHSQRMTSDFHCALAHGLYFTADYQAPIAYDYIFVLNKPVIDSVLYSARTMEAGCLNCSTVASAKTKRSLQLVDFFGYHILLLGRERRRAYILRTQLSKSYMQKYDSRTLHNGLSHSRRRIVDGKHGWGGCRDLSQQNDIAQTPTPIRDDGKTLKSDMSPPKCGGADINGRASSCNPPSNRLLQTSSHLHTPNLSALSMHTLPSHLVAQPL